MKTPPEISNLNFLLKEEEKVASSLGEALNKVSKEKLIKVDEVDNVKNENFNNFFYFIAFLILGAIIVNYLTKKEKKKKTDKENKEQIKWEKLIHLYDKYDETKSSKTFQELNELFESIRIYEVNEEVYLILSELKNIVEYKNAILAYIQSIINPINKRDSHRKKFRFLFKNLDDEHSFNMILA